MSLSLSRHHVLAAILAAFAVVAAAGLAESAQPSCRGAAARDPLHPCTNPKLLLAVAPRPSAALLETDSPCHPFRRATVISVCYFGAPATAARESVAILGDSHATHWRPALEVVAGAKGWRGASITRTSCPFELGTSASLSPALGKSCLRHNRAIPGWLAKRPWIDTVFVAGNAGARVRPRAGRSSFSETVRGALRALKSLPLTVRHVIVVRDPPKSTFRTKDCIQRALSSHRAAGPACAVPASLVTRADPLVLAARQIGTRVQVIDLKDFQCSTSVCFPVVGGVLVHQDIDHLTRLFATTLGPYLLRALDRLAAGWPTPTASSAIAASTPCLGAAARDAQHPCSNPKLRLTVTPKPLDAQIEADSPCQSVAAAKILELCTFGAPLGAATETVALIGDSHATHWRPALDVVAQAKGWRVMNMTRTSCPFSAAPPDKGRTIRKQCAQRNREAPKWLAAHPFVSTLFVAGHAGVRVFGAKESLRFKYARSGYLKTLRGLPATIKHIVVIHDVVNAKSGTIDCVRRAIRARQPAWRVCALKRSVVARVDPAVAAAKQIGAPRVQSIDLRSFQCSKRICFPVVGGVLVHKDVGHITRLFGTTLGPYMLRAINQVQATW